MTSKKFIYQKYFPYVGRIISLIVVLSVSGVLVITWIRRSGKIIKPPPIPRVPDKGGNILSITEGYEFISRDEKTGKTKIKLIAAKDIAYADGRHELDQLDLTTFAPDGKETSNIRADHGSYQQQNGLVSFTGKVTAKNADGLEVKSEKLNYDQNNEVAMSDVLVNFSFREINGSSTGAEVRLKEKTIALHKDARLVVTKKNSNDPPVELRGQKAFFARAAGTAVFEGSAAVVQGQQSGSADKLTGVFTTTPAGQEQKLIRVEARGNALLKSQEKDQTSEFQARDMDFHFDEQQRLKLAGGWGGAKARSLEKNSPREITAEKIEVTYTPTDKGSAPASVITQGRTIMKISAPEGTNDKKAAERVLEADTVQASFHPGGEFLSRAEAIGNAILTVTPLVVNEKSDRQRLRAPKFTADFLATNNLLKTFVADDQAMAEFEPIRVAEKQANKRPKRTLNGRKMTANFDQQMQDVADLTIDGEAKYNEGVKTATAAKAIYNAATRAVALRGKPQVWDEALRVSADEIDANAETSESVARGRVRTTYYSRETTGGAAPFKKPKAPVFIASDRALVKHREGAARYEGNARAWQDDNFVRAATIELDRNEKTMMAIGSVNSALYHVEREIEVSPAPATTTPAQASSLPVATGKPAKKKEVIPIFATADRMDYSDATRVVRYSGNVIVRQGADRIDSATTEISIDEENKIEKMIATTNVVLTQPMRRGSGDQLEYTAVTDTAVLTGNLARIEDREREAVTTGAKLTLHLADARIQAADEGGSRRVKTTHRIKQK